MITEEEARKKWCPFARVISVKRGAVGAPLEDQGVPAHNRRQVEGVLPANSIPDGGYCIASECMAWEWGVEMRSPEITGNVVTKDDGHGIQLLSEPNKIPVELDKGDCGLKRK